ncbi:hypothetical protein ACQP1O_29685 [Nocardia sp. CA-151230]|uniref:hypothetical protein n=1 Tax=Nocardia sp. CA-151230 TaxID=3239982 RepID=UPI003D8BB578
MTAPEDGAEPHTANFSVVAFRIAGHEVTLEPGGARGTFRVLVDARPIPMTLITINRGYSNRRPKGYEYVAEPVPADSIKTVAGWGTLRNLRATTDSGRPVLQGTLEEGSAESYNTVVKFEESVRIEFTADLSAAKVTVDNFSDDAT